MNKAHSNDGIDGLIHTTIDVVHLNLTTENTKRKRVEYLPYPDWNLQENLVDEISTDHKNVYAQHQQTFIPGLPVQVTKIQAEKVYNPMREFFYPYLYTITINHGSIFEWTITRRYKHFLDLHKTLLNYVQSFQYKSKNNFNTIADQEEQACFPIENDRLAFINSSSGQERCKMLQTYLNQILKHPKFREHPAMKTFLEVSPLSFIEGLGQSRKEGDLLKRLKIGSHNQSIFIHTPFILDKFKSNHGRKWFIIKDSYVVYIQMNSTIIGFPLLIDQAFKIHRTFRKTKSKHGIRLKNLQASMLIKCHRKNEQEQWFKCLLELKNQSIFAQQQRFQSFAPQRQQQYAQWFINGQAYMEALAKAILSAREEIFITDWWLSPELMLIRPFEDESMRLDNLLGRRAEEGIRIYVLIFKDIRSSLGLNSHHSKRQLISQTQLKPNIKIIRYPYHQLPTGTKSSLFYSPHEKTVIIDQRLAFIGGIDLCWGRWDDEHYRLVDLADENITELKSAQELSNEHKQEEIVLGKKIDMQENNTNEYIRAIALNSQANIEATNKIEKQLEYELHHSKSKWQKLIKINRKNNEHDSTDDESIGKQEQTTVEMINDKQHLFPGKDYSNYYKKDFEDLENFDQDYIDRKSTPRMPWHDEVLVVAGEAARDCARHFIQRWNIHKRDRYRFDEFFPYLLPKTYDDPDLFDLSLLHSILPDNRPPVCVDAQCIRSASFWSCGIHTIEHSVENAYIHMIDNAKHFIYIENQFFITIADDVDVQNKLADAFYRRIIRADVNKEKFRIYIVLPLLPAFANSHALQAVLHFNMKSINHGQTSLYQRLKQNGVVHPEEYITFYGMRNWDILMGRLVTEIIYVHGKLMIVDDRMCICGSANINDRSLLGHRDSEICLVVNDVQMMDSCLNNQTEKVGLFCSTWRKKLFRHLLGIENEEDISVDDPCKDEFYQYFRQRAKTNTEIYEELFNAIPTNQIRQFDHIKAYVQRSRLKDSDPQTAYDKCKQIQGFVVEFPIDFLADDVIIPKWNTIEGIAPTSLWT